MFGRKRIFHQVFQLVAHLGNVQADDDLNPVAAANYPVGAQRFKDVVTLRFRHIDQRDAQSGGAVINAFDIARSAQRLQEAGGLAQFGICSPRNAGFAARGLVIRFAVELNFTLFTARRFQVEAQDYLNLQTSIYTSNICFTICSDTFSTTGTATLFPNC